MVEHKRPLIGVTGPRQHGRHAWLFTRFALRRAGARAVRIMPSSDPLKTPLDGLVIGGGDDIDPHRYGAVAKLAIKIDRERDDLEWRMLEYAEQHTLPVLGICRGAQLLNVFYGGTLHQDIRDIVQNLILRRTVLPRKSIYIRSGTHLQNIMATLKTRVNSLHHQAVDRLADGFRVAAHDGDNIVQAIEHIDRQFLVGVQWHPEYLPQLRNQRRLFQALVTAAGCG